MPGWGTVNNYVSNNRGGSWTTNAAPATLSALAGSSDLSVLFFGTSRGAGGLVFESISTPSSTGVTTVGTGGSVTLGGSDALELQYLGAGLWGVLSAVGNDFLIK